MYTIKPKLQAAVSLAVVISLNCGAAVGLQLQETASRETAAVELNRVVVSAFDAVRNGFSADEVLLDDNLQLAFIENCQKQLPEASIESLNWALLNLRKQGKLSHLKTTKTHRVALDDLRHIAEIAARSVQDHYVVSTDRIIVNPEYRAEFQRVAQQVSPDVDLYRVRKAMFQLRKARQLKPELILRVADWDRVVATFSVDQLADLELVPESPGIYIFRDATGYLYIGESKNLRARLKSHLDSGDKQSLIRYLDSQGHAAPTIEVHSYESGSRMSQLVVRRAYESELIRSRNPKFNIRP